MEQNTYECAVCHNTYEKGWSDEEALKEAADIFAKPVKDWECNAAIVCDDCFNKAHPSKFPAELEQAKKLI